MKEFAKLQTDPCDVIRLFPDLLAPQDNTKLPAKAANLPILEDRDLENGLLALIDYLTEVRYHLKVSMQTSANNTLPTNIIDTKPFGKNLNSLLSIIDTTLLKCYLQVRNF